MKPSHLPSFSIICLSDCSPPICSGSLTVKQSHTDELRALFGSEAERGSSRVPAHSGVHDR